MKTASQFRLYLALANALLLGLNLTLMVFFVVFTWPMSADTLAVAERGHLSWAVFAGEAILVLALSAWLASRYYQVVCRQSSAINLVVVCVLLAVTQYFFRMLMGHY